METVMTRHQSFHGAFRAELRFHGGPPLDEPPQPRAHAAPLWMWRATQVNFVRHDPSPRLIFRADERRRVKAVRQS
jgi:hypothetical protein